MNINEKKHNTMRNFLTQLFNSTKKDQVEVSPKRPKMIQKSEKDQVKVPKCQSVTEKVSKSQSLTEKIKAKFVNFVNFANFVMQKINNIANIANIAMQKFVTVSGERIAVSGGSGVEDTMSVGQQPTNIQLISNLSPTINRFKLHIATLTLFLCLGVGM